MSTFKKFILQIWYALVNAIAQATEKSVPEPEPAGIVLARQAFKKAKKEWEIADMHYVNALFAAKRAGVEIQYKAELKKLGVNMF
jgi:hypothetical protein